jgi:phosphopantetheine adenylyltransferase
MIKLIDSPIQYLVVSKETKKKSIEIFKGWNINGLLGLDILTKVTNRKNITVIWLVNNLYK